MDFRSIFKNSKPNHTFVDGFPNFLCIGAQKAGTSWLYSALEEHPDIFLGPCKEIHFFDEIFLDAVKNWAKNSRLSLLKQGLYYKAKEIENPQQLDVEFLTYYGQLFLSQKEGIDWYKEYFLFPRAKEKVKGEITPEYSMLPDEGIKYILESINKDIKIIYIVRDPVTRALSQLRMNLSRSQITEENLNEDLLIEKMNEVVKEKRADYKEYITRWDNFIPENNIIYLPYNLIKKPWVFIKKVENFLGVPHFPNYKKLEHIVHKTKKYELPELTNNYFKEIYSDQYVFLEQRFDKSFVNLL